MFNICRHIFCCLLSICLFFTSLSYAAGKYDSYSADYVEVNTDGTTKKIGKIFESNGKVLLELSYPPDSGRTDIIIDYNTKKGYSIFYKFKKYWDSTLTKEEQLETPPSFGLGTFREQRDILGNEKVNGFDCVKSRVTTIYNLGGKENVTSSLVWKANNFLNPVKSEISTGKTFETRNIVLQKVPESKFLIPNGFKRITHISQLAQ